MIIIPPQEIVDFVDNYRKQFARYTSYVIPPHFTIYPPFYSNFSTEDELITHLRNNFKKVKPEIISLKSIGFFEGKNNVAFFEPTLESSSHIVNFLTLAIKCLKDKVKNVYDSYNFTPEKFKPHMTIAEKIPSQEFPAIKEEFTKISVDWNFKVTAIYLYKQIPNTVIWTEVANIDLN